MKEFQAVVYQGIDTELISIEAQTIDQARMLVGMTLPYGWQLEDLKEVE